MLKNKALLYYISITKADVYKRQAQVNIVAIIAASWLIPASDSISALVNIMYTLATNVVHPANTSVLMI